jgi:hypothetical protein
MSAADETSNLTPVEQAFERFEDQGKLEKVNDEKEVVDYLLYTIRLARKKTTSRKIPDVTKVKWCKVAVDASKALLFSGILDKRSRREVKGYEAFFMSIMKEKPTEKEDGTDVEQSVLE